MTYRFKVLRPRAGTAMALTSVILSFIRHGTADASSGQAHRHPFSAGTFAVHAMGCNRSRAFQKIQSRF